MYSREQPSHNIMLLAEWTICKPKLRRGGASLATFTHEGLARETRAGLARGTIHGEQLPNH